MSLNNPRGNNLRVKDDGMFKYLKKKSPDAINIPNIDKSKFKALTKCLSAMNTVATADLSHIFNRQNSEKALKKAVKDNADKSKQPNNAIPKTNLEKPTLSYSINESTTNDNFVNPYDYLKPKTSEPAIKDEGSMSDTLQDPPTVKNVIDPKPLSSISVNVNSYDPEQAVYTLDNKGPSVIDKEEPVHAVLKKEELSQGFDPDEPFHAVERSDQPNIIDDTNESEDIASNPILLYSGLHDEYDPDEPVHAVQKYDLTDNDYDPDEPIQAVDRSVFKLKPDYKATKNTSGQSSNPNSNPEVAVNPTKVAPNIQAEINDITDAVNRYNSQFKTSNDTKERKVIETLQTQESKSPVTVDDVREMRGGLWNQYEADEKALKDQLLAGINKAKQDGSSFDREAIDDALADRLQKYYDGVDALAPLEAEAKAREDKKNNVTLPKKETPRWMQIGRETPAQKITELPKLTVEEQFTPDKIGYNSYIRRDLNLRDIKAMDNERLRQKENYDELLSFIEDDRNNEIRRAKEEGREPDLSSLVEERVTNEKRFKADQQLLHDAIIAQADREADEAWSEDLI